MQFKIPYYSPPWNPGIQVVNLQQGGPSSHVTERVTAPRISPSVYPIMCMGMAMIPPRQVLGPTNPIQVNQYNYAPSITNLEIAHLMKKQNGQ